jgi:hypothetical protein
MTATARAAVNAANASLATGPRTEEGKARSSRNAVKHGLASKQLVHRPGERQEFAELHDSLLEQLAPEGALEMGLFSMVRHAAWSLQRFRTLEAQLMTNGLESLLDESTAARLDCLQRHTTANQRAYFSALKQLRDVQQNRLLPPHPGRPRRRSSARVGVARTVGKTNPGWQPASRDTPNPRKRDVMQNTCAFYRLGPGTTTGVQTSSTRMLMENASMS